MTDLPQLPLRLQLDQHALTENWHALDRLSGAANCGAAVKADGYGLGARDVVSKLLNAGCRDFFVAAWVEAAGVQDLMETGSLTVLNGVLEEDMKFATKSRCKPMLNSTRQVELWRSTGLPCDVMIDTGMNRLGMSTADAVAIDWNGLEVDTLASHLASADEDSGQNDEQLAAFRSVIDAVPHRRTSLANSAGIALGEDFQFDLTRPGLSIYGGIPRAELADAITPVGKIECQILQLRELDAGDRVGYNATYTAKHPMKIAIISIGYADGYLCGFSGTGSFFCEGTESPVLGRVSMDLVALDVTSKPGLSEGDWVSLPLDLPKLSSQSGLSQYEVLTSLGTRHDRRWSD